MHGALTWLLGSARFIPHGYCLLWRPDLVAIHVVSDALIAVAYFAIPLAIYSFVRQRTDLKATHKRIALLFVAFICWCGVTHIASIVTLWEPYYGLQALAKAITAAVSVATAAALPFVIPRLLLIPSPEALSVANGALTAEVHAHQSTLKLLQTARGDLERQIAERTEDLRVANARFRAALANSQVSLAEQDAERRYTWVYNPGAGFDEREVIGRREEDFLPVEPAAKLRDMRESALATGEPQRGEVRIALPETELWFDMKIEPARLRTGAPGLLSIATDITAQKRQQQHLATVSRELNHRAKNLLAIVQSIARQTAKGADVPELFLAAFNERLRALAATHDVLVRENWIGADLAAVVRSQLEHQLAAYPGRIAIKGPAVPLPPEAAHYVGLALHELGANAAKYGALANDAGRVDLQWRCDVEPGGGKRLQLNWTEVGGPTPSIPRRKGFGSSILEQLTPRALGGSASLAFEPAGARWTLDAPIRPETARAA